MNVSPQLPNLSIPTVVNPPTEILRRENNQREIITQPAPTGHSSAEKGVASDKERGRTPAQNNEKIDFISLEERAEQENKSIADQNSEQSSQHSSSQNSDENVGENSQENKQTAQDSFESFEQEQKISELKRRDQEVRSHELAHAAVGGASTGAPSYLFEIGPDGKKYAVAGEVSVDLSRVEGNPQATIAKMQKVHAAALAPANPSVQDTRVAATAAQIILQAQSELLAMHSEEFTQPNAINPNYLNPNSAFKNEQQSGHSDHLDSLDFDIVINKTLKSQDNVLLSTTSPKSEKLSVQEHDVLLRSHRIEQFYSNITLAYEKPPNFQFELTA